MKVYAQKARLDGDIELCRLLSAISESEAIQAKRLFYSARGKVDMSEDYLQTVFEEEIPAVIDMLSANLIQAAQDDNTPMIQALSQLRSVERRNQAFYLIEEGETKIAKGEDYAICQFCGYISAGETLPASCPVCGASCDDFKQMNK